MSAEIKEEV